MSILCMQEGAMHEVGIPFTEMGMGFIQMDLDMMSGWAFPMSRNLTIHVLVFMEDQILDEVSYTPLASFFFIFFTENCKHKVKVNGATHEQAGDGISRQLI